MSFAELHLIAHVETFRTRPGMQATNTTDPAGGPHLGQLWGITDIAQFLGVCENTARAIYSSEPDCPRPIIERGSVRRWHGAQWHHWAANRAGLTPAPAPNGDPNDWTGAFS